MPLAQGDRIAQGTVPIEKNMLGELREMAAKFTPQAVSSGTADRQVALLEQLLERLDKLEGQVNSTAQQQEALGRQQQRLETVTVESLSTLRNGQR